MALLGGCSASLVDVTFRDGGEDAAEALVPVDVAVEPEVFVPADTGAPEDCATPWDDDGDGLANEDCPCPTPGERQACFNAPPGSLRGLCRLGSQVCLPAGSWGPCVDAWLPLRDGACELVEDFPVTSESRAPADVVWVVDTSGSMTAEVVSLNANLNRFAAYMGANGIDYRVVMLARRGTTTLRVCVPPPLGGAGCADSPRFQHVDQMVNSTDGLQVILSSMPRWQGFLRPDSVRFFVMVTDDESSLTADAFHSQLLARPGWSGYVFDAIVGYETRTDCPTMVRRGSHYLTLSARTGGDRARVCESDWSGLFNTFARSIVARLNNWPLSASPRADTLRVSLVLADGREAVLASGWRFDPATGRVHLDTSVMPPPGSRVRVTYRPAAASP